MSQAHKDADAQQVIKTAIGQFLGEIVDEVEAHAGDDHNDRPAFFVTVFLKAGQRALTGADWLETMVAATAALRAIDDERLINVTFFAPEYHSADDTRRSA